MVQVEFNEINNNIKYKIFLFYYLNNKYLNKYNNVTTFSNHKVSHKMKMPCKLVWMDEKFM